MTIYSGFSHEKKVIFHSYVSLPEVNHPTGVLPLWKQWGFHQAVATSHLQLGELRTPEPELVDARATSLYPHRITATTSPCP